MSSQSLPQYARVEQPFGVEPPSVRCPICGEEGYKMFEGPPWEETCPHLAFLYPSEAGEFVFESKDFEKRTKGLKLGFPGLDNLEDYLQKAGYNNSLLVIEITYGGMACGPTWFTDAYGFDYSTLE